jgi:hypothetical protein
MAGADVLDVEATAAKDDQVLNRWKTGSGSIVGGLIPSRHGWPVRAAHQHYGSTYRGRVVRHAASRMGNATVVVRSPLGFATATRNDAQLESSTITADGIPPRVLCDLPHHCR